MTRRQARTSARDPMLQKTLRSNAVFSGLSGVLLLAAAGPVGVWIGVSEPWVLRIIGAGLVGFCVALILLARSERPDPRLVLGATVADFAWVVGSAVLLAGFPDLLTTDGKVAVAGVAVIVAAFGIGQWVGLRGGRDRRRGETQPVD